jgi:hypothetical protein
MGLLSWEEYEAEDELGENAHCTGVAVVEISIGLLPFVQ